MIYYCAKRAQSQGFAKLVAKHRGARHRGTFPAHEKTRRMPAKTGAREIDAAQASIGKQRTYNSRSMAERRARIIAATLAIIEEEGLNGVTIRNVSKRAGVALRTLYLYFDNREAIISVAIKEFFHQRVEAVPDPHPPATIADVTERLDRLSNVIQAARAYSAALAPIYFSANLDAGIYAVLKSIALSHVFPFLDNMFAATRARVGPQLKELICTQIANTEYAIINDVLVGRLPEDLLALCLKTSVLACVAGFLPKVPAELARTLADLQASFA